MNLNFIISSFDRVDRQQDDSLKKDRYFNKRRASLKMFINMKALRGNYFKYIYKWDDGE